MHLLWVSDSPDTPSGFGTVTRFVCSGLARRGHTVSVLGWQSTEVSQHDGCTVYPIGRFGFGSDALYLYLLEHRPDAVVVLGDIAWLPSITPPWVRRHLVMTATPLVLYFPVDGVRADGLLPPSWIDLLSYADVAVAMSRYGQAVAEQCEVPARYIPHGVDLELFRPPPDRDEAKRRAGVADRFVVLSDSRNQPRKMLPRLLDIFAAFAAEHPQALLHLHTDPFDTRQVAYSYDVLADIRHRRLSGQVHITDGFRMRRGRGLPLSRLAAMYQAADVHLLASTGEGFGLPNLQAAAVGAVPLAGAHSACRELVEGHGHAIPIAEWIEDEFGIRRGLVDVEDAAGALAGYCDDADRLRRDAARSRVFAQGYGWDTTVEAWDTLLCALPDRPMYPRRLGLRRAADLTLAAHGPFRASMTVTVRAFDHVEARLAADRSGREVHLPVSPRPAEVGGVPRLRRPGLVCASPPDAPELRTLCDIFPVLRAWFPGPEEAAAGGYPWLTALAESILVLNLDAALPEPVLAAAAVLGVPCLGTGDTPLQAALWPELSLARPEDAVPRARTLLTNASFMNRSVANAEQIGRHVVAPALWRVFTTYRDYPAGSMSPVAEGAKHV
jgi:glycosyltransferase involved in cell wall biosynthesis